MNLTGFGEDALNLTCGGRTTLNLLGKFITKNGKRIILHIFKTARKPCKKTSRFWEINTITVKIFRCKIFI